MTDKSNAYQWRWDPVAEAWVKQPASCLTKRMVATGQVYTGACRLH